MIPNPDGVAPVEKRGDAVATGTNSLDDGLTQCFICKDWYYKCISDHKRMDNPVAMCKTLMCEQEPVRVRSAGRQEFSPSIQV